MISTSQIKHAKSLHHKKFRDLHDLFLAEGEKIVAELPKSNLFVESVFATSHWIETNRGIFSAETLIHEASSKDLERISTLKTPSSVVAVVKKPLIIDDFSTIAHQPILVLDTIQDPGNLGTIIRTADWFGIKQVVCSRETAELYNPKVIQATMGSFARVNIAYLNLPEFLNRFNGGKTIFGATLKGEPISQLKPHGDSILVIGNESRGISKEVKPYLTKEIKIPGGQAAKSAESLNAAVAAGILMAWLIVNI